VVRLAPGRPAKASAARRLDDSLKILVAEDSTTVRRLLRARLKADGYDVRASNATCQKACHAALESGSDGGSAPFSSAKKDAIVSA